VKLAVASRQLAATANGGEIGRLTADRHSIHHSPFTIHASCLKDESESS